MNGLSLIDSAPIASSITLARQQALARAQGPADSGGAAFQTQLRDAAEQLVASALLMPALEQVTSSPLRPQDGPLAETVVEKRFGPLLHQHLADRIMRGRSFGLVDAVVQRLAQGIAPERLA